MSKMQFKITPARTSESMYILCTQETPDEDGVIEIKTAFIKVEPDKAEALLAKLEKGERIVRFTDRIAGNQYEVNVLKAVNAPAPAAGELAHK